MSRHVPIGMRDSADLLEDMEEYVNFVTKHSPPKAMTLERIARATFMDDKN